MNLPTVIVAGITGAIVGWIARANLNRLGYRHDDEQQHPAPDHAGG